MAHGTQGSSKGASENLRFRSDESGLNRVRDSLRQPQDTAKDVTIIVVFVES